jgi:NAD(P)-dependent dehydrogenase (short-subunit alcohol dehydrogenase family)
LLVGAKRIGVVVAERLAREGVRIAIGYRRSRKEAQRLHDTLARQGAHVALVQGDLSVEDDVRRMVRVAQDDLGDLSFVVNMASDFPRAPLGQLDRGAWDLAMASAKGAYLLAVHAGRAMMAKPGPTRGHLLFFTDWAATETPYRNYLPYLTSKAAMDYMVRAFAVEYAPHGVLVNAIAPGPTLKHPRTSDRAWEQETLGRAPLRRESSAEDIAEMVVTLLRSETITGETVRVDSGRHLAGPGLQA